MISRISAGVHWASIESHSDNPQNLTVLTALPVNKHARCAEGVMYRTCTNVVLLSHSSQFDKQTTILNDIDSFFC